MWWRCCKKETNANVDIRDTVPFVAPITGGVVIRVYDGDTITVASRLPYAASPLYRFQIRLVGIDCPEIKAKSALAQDAKRTVEQLCLHRYVRLKVSPHPDKFGRVLADVFVTGDNKKEVHVNALLVERGLAVAYDGGTKKEWIV